MMRIVIKKVVSEGKKQMKLKAENIMNGEEMGVIIIRRMQGWKGRGRCKQEPFRALPIGRLNSCLKYSILIGVIELRGGGKIWTISQNPFQNTLYLLQ